MILFYVSFMQWQIKKALKDRGRTDHKLHCNILIVIFKNNWKINRKFLRLIFCVFLHNQIIHLKYKRNDTAIKKYGTKGCCHS